MYHLRSLSTYFSSCMTSLFKEESIHFSQAQPAIHDRKERFGDFATSLPLSLSKKLNTSPQQIAKKIEEFLLSDPVFCSIIDATLFCPPGFLNIKLSNKWWLKAATSFAQSPQEKISLSINELKKIHLEYVSANPTGPLHVAHGRSAVLGDTLSRVLKALGHEVFREYYINDAGQQISLLGASVKARALEQQGELTPFPEGGYKGEYIKEVAQKFHTQSKKNAAAVNAQEYGDFACSFLLERIKKDLSEYNVFFDGFFSEKNLALSGSIERTVQLLTDGGFTYEKEGALWFTSTSFGDEEDRVLKKADGAWTYIAPDIAYHLDKFARGYDKYVVFLGQDHHSYACRLHATLTALGHSKEKLDIILCQMVSLKRSEQLIKMSKRSGNFELLSEIIEEVGTDAARYFYLNKRADAHLEFDLDLAVERSQKNPAFYIQYAYVRTRGIIEKAAQNSSLEKIARNYLAGGMEWTLPLLAQENQSLADEEIDLIKEIDKLPIVLKNIEQSYQVHLLAYYALGLAQKFHAYYNNTPIIDETEKAPTRLCIVMCTRLALDITLELLGLSKPEKM